MLKGYKRQGKFGRIVAGSVCEVTTRSGICLQIHPDLEKYCPGCDTILPRTDFTFRKTTGEPASRCRICCARDMAEWRARTSPEDRAAIKRRHRLARLDAVLKYTREYHESHKPERARRAAERKACDVEFKIKEGIKRTIAGAIRRAIDGRKCASTVDLVGCDIRTLMDHISAQWQFGMTWGNWGRRFGCWHIDHIRPIASFDLTQPHEQLACFNYKNLQPLWAEDNLRKGSKWIGEGVCGV